MSQLLRLAWSDLLDEWPVALAVTAAIAAVLAPLLVLNGLQSGIVGEIFERLRADPALRRITLDATGAKRFDTGWFARIRARPDVAFILPATRFAAAQVDAVAAARPNAAPQRVQLVPTGAGDPVFSAGDLEGTAKVRLSALVAERLETAIGDRIIIDVERRRADGRIEAAGLEATVAAIAEPAAHRGTVIFAHPDLLRAVEQFRDGFAAPSLGWVEGPSAEETEIFPNFRLYARRIEDVAGLAAHLRDAEGLSVSARDAEIASAIQLDGNISAVLRAIGLLAIVGLAGTLAAVQWAAAMRKRRTVATLSLIGYGPGWLVGFPVVQGITFAIVGSAAGSLLAGAAAAWINHSFAGSFGASGAACRLTAGSIAGGGLLVLVFSLLPALLIGWRITRLQPSEEIRDV